MLNHTMRISQVGYITKQLMTSFNLNIVKNIGRFWKEISGQLKIGELSAILATWNF